MVISAVVNTYNEEKNIERCLKSLAWCDEIIVWDAQSIDDTVKIAKKYTDKFFVHQDTSGYVEPQRNAAIDKASGEWILIVDADEEISQKLAEHLKSLKEQNAEVNYYELARKNIVFNKWLKGSGWWPDYNIRFFKKGNVTWTNAIHVPPKTEGIGQKLDAVEDLAIIHHHYESIDQYLSRLHRYTSVQAKELQEAGYTFLWQDIIRKPLSEFLTRFFVWKGYEDGLHGLALSLLQAFSFLIVYLKVWEAQGFKEINNPNFPKEVEAESEHAKKELSHWFKQTVGNGFLKKLLSH